MRNSRSPGRLAAAGHASGFFRAMFPAARSAAPALLILLSLLCWGVGRRAQGGEPPRGPKLAAGPDGSLVGGYQIRSGDDAAFDLVAVRTAENDSVTLLGRFNGRLAGVAATPEGECLALTRDGALSVYGDEPAVLARADDRWNMLALVWHDGGPAALNNDDGRLHLVRPTENRNWDAAATIATDPGVHEAALVSLAGELHLVWSGRPSDLSRGALRHMVLRDSRWEELDSLPIGNVRHFTVFAAGGELALAALAPHPLRNGPDRIVARLWRNGKWVESRDFPGPATKSAPQPGDFAGAGLYPAGEAFLVCADGGLFLLARGGTALSGLPAPMTARLTTVAAPAPIGAAALDSSWLFSTFLLVLFVAMLLLYCRRSRRRSLVQPGAVPDLPSRGAALALDWVFVSLAMSVYHFASGDLNIYPELLTVESVNSLFWINLGAFSLYMAVFECLYGRSPGKYLAGIRVRSLLGGRPSPLQALFRNLMRGIDMFPMFLPGVLGAIAAMLNVRRQRVGDVLAATVVRRHAPFRARRFLLASRSPRRVELLSALGVEVRVCPADIDETIAPGDDPETAARGLAEAKARAVAEQAAGNLEILVAADTMVVLDGEILGKPVDEADAARMLSMLSGRSHRVVTGVSVWDPATGQGLSDVELTEVEFRTLSEREIADYVGTGDPMDKAGGYGVQTGFLVKEIRGSLSNVAGLPMELLQGMLSALES